ncbi:hypothetical protein N7454_010498 [Penicillium verhagenii]|nr:hypothetical protein N7454_010498 [Penicillium verhagenii]
MMQTILSPVDVWPGGIPAAVRLHPDSVSDEDGLLEEIKGWCRYLKEFRIPNSDPAEDMTQRRALIERWASADQSFRDSYHSNAPLPNLIGFNGPRMSKRFICLVDKPFDHENYPRITKLLILLYIHLQLTSGHPFSFDRGPIPQVPAFMLDPNTITASADDQYAQLLTTENIPVNYYLETAQFSTMAMTRSGTVVFPRLDEHAYFVIDNQSCQDGRLRLLIFGPNGQIINQARMTPFTIGPLTLLRHTLGHSWDELFEERPDMDPRWNQPIDIHLPILEIVAGLSQRGDLAPLNDYTAAEWAEEFERFAPGYLAFERQGRVIEYSWDRLVDVSDGPFLTYGHLRYARQLATLQGRG